jgi:hypothetical protein
MRTPVASLGGRTPELLVIFEDGRLELETVRAEAIRRFPWLTLGRGSVSLKNDRETNLSSCHYD